MRVHDGSNIMNYHKPHVSAYYIMSLYRFVYLHIKIKRLLILSVWDHGLSSIPMTSEPNETTLVETETIPRMRGSRWISKLRDNAALSIIKFESDSVRLDMMLVFKVALGN